jgi:hypothetical protein
MVKVCSCVRCHRCVRREHSGFFRTLKRTTYYTWPFQRVSRNFRLAPVRPSLNCAEPLVFGWLGGLTVSVGNTQIFCRRGTENRTIICHFGSYLANSVWSPWSPASLLQILYGWTVRGSDRVSAGIGMSFGNTPVFLYFADVEPRIVL